MPDAELLPLHSTAIRALLAVVSQVRPNFRSVANAAGVASTNTIDAHLRRLRAMGLVDWEEHRLRDVAGAGAIGAVRDGLMTWEGLNPPYRTIVADPPWDHSDGTGVMSNSLKDPVAFAERGWLSSAGVPYSMMSITEIAALPVSDLGNGGGCHLYLWTTNRYLRDAYNIAEAWGFAPVKPIVWCKAPKAPFMGGPFGGASVEFCLFGRRGNLSHTGRAGRQWFEWPRGEHSVKPAAFMDLVERVSPGPYVELFARAPRLGWDSWGYGYETSAR